MSLSTTNAISHSMLSNRNLLWGSGKSIDATASSPPPRSSQNGADSAALLPSSPLKNQWSTAEPRRTLLCSLDDCMETKECGLRVIEEVADMYLCSMVLGRHLGKSMLAPSDSSSVTRLQLTSTGGENIGSKYDFQVWRRICFHPL